MNNTVLPNDSAVICKFRYVKETKIPLADGAVQSEVTLTTQYDSELAKEDAAFSKFTPSGTLTATINNPEALRRLELGKSYYVTLTPVPEPEKAA